MFIADKPSAVASPPAKRYRSMFRPQNMSATRPLQYDSYKFKRVTFKVYEDGDTVKVPCEDIETILVARDWQRYTRGLNARGGFIGKGWSKFAFRVSILQS